MNRFLLEPFATAPFWLMLTSYSAFVALIFLQFLVLT